MEIQADRIQQLREHEPDAALILDTYEELEQVYRDALQAMGINKQHEPTVGNTAEVTISFQPTSRSADR